MIRNINIILTDDSDVFRNSAKDYLTKELFVNIIGEASNGTELLMLNNIHKADILLLDIEMPKLNGIETAKKIIYENSKTKIIAVTMFESREYWYQMIFAGFKGCVFKSDFFETIEIAIKKVLQNKLYYPKTF